ncbi:cohesin domain-containing protein [Candidatus Latescibacterota bacterium]
MSSKRLIFLILLLMVGMAGQVFAQATLTVAPTTVPRGAYVNGPLGEDNYFWMSVTIEANKVAGHAAVSTITIHLPTGLTIADVAGGGVDGEVTVSWEDNGANNLDEYTVNAATTASQIVLDVVDVLMDAGDIVTVMFPVETTLSATNASTNDIWVDFSDDAAGTDDEIDDNTGQVITFVDPGPNTLGLVTFTEELMLETATGFYDSTRTDGEIYPVVGVDAYFALPDYIKDYAGQAVAFTAGANLPTEVATAFEGTTIGAGVDNNDMFFRVYASTDSTLNHVDVDDTGVILLRNHSAAPYDYSQETFTGNQGLTVANLPEGEWYFYVISSLTGDFPLGRSDKLTVMHWPKVDVFAWDYDDDGTLESVADNFEMTLDTGLYLSVDGNVITAAPSPTDYIDLYLAVDDFDDDADISLFYSTTLDLDESHVQVSGTSPDQVVTGLSGATAGTLIVNGLEENDEDDNGFIKYTWDIGTTVEANEYMLYAVANDGKQVDVKRLMGFDLGEAPDYSGLSTYKVNIKHSPDLSIDSLDEYDLGSDAGEIADVTIDPFQTDVIMLSWGKSSVDDDKDIDDSATIAFYLVEDDTDNGLTPLYGSDDWEDVDDEHEIVTGILEDPEGKADSYYAWNIKDDWLANGGTWAPLAHGGANIYHLYGIISEGEGETKRVVCLGIDGVFAAGVASTPTRITFDITDNGYVKLYDPPLDGVSVGATDTYQMNFEAFDLTGDQNVGIFLVKEVAGELVSNGDFEDGATGWTAPANWSFSAGEALYDGLLAGTISQPFTTAATNYTVTFTIRDYVGDGIEGLDITLEGQALVGNTFIADGTYSEVVASPGGVAGLVITPSAGGGLFTCTLDDVSVKLGTGTYTDGEMTPTITEISALLDGDAYALTTQDGELANFEWLSEDTDTYLDVMLWEPGDVVSGKYTEDLNSSGTALTDGNYWAYIGLAAGDFAAGETLYRAPGLLTISGLAGGSPQQNLSMEPRKFVSTVGDVDTISVRAYSGVPVDIIDLYIAVDKTFFDLDDTVTPFIDANFGSATLVANEAIDDTDRWVLHATFTNAGDDIAPTAGGLGDELLRFTVISKGTDTAIGETTSFSYLNESGNGYVTRYVNDGTILPFIASAVNIEVMPRGIIDGIVELQSRASSSAVVTFNLRDRGSYETTSDSTFIAANDGEQEGIAGKMDAGLYAPDGIQYRLDNNGSFTLYQIPPGEWDLYVYYERYLANSIEVDVTTGLDSLFIDFGELLGGDAMGYTDENNDMFPNNAINQDDVDRINEAFGSTSSNTTKWDNDTDPLYGGDYNYKWADIDEDDLVGILDLTMATGNFTYGGSANLGAQPVYLKPAVGTTGSAGAFVEFVNIPSEMKSGETYSFQVIINNAVNVKGYDVRMDFDQSALTFVDIEKGDFIKDDSNSFSINSDGTFGLVNTVYGPPAYSGDGILAEVTFRAITDGVFTTDMLGISQATVVDNNYKSFELFAVDAPTGISTEIPVEFSLNQNFPNPFNPTTTISFSIPRSSNVEIKIYNVLGRYVTTLASGAYEPGNYSIVWDATDMNGNLVSNGMYFCTINAADYHSTTKMMFMK